jgi:hypothetical protein
MYFEIYQSGTQWRWRLKSGNHEIIASGEGYVSKAGAEHAIQLVISTGPFTPIRYV